jgi:glycerol-3-phosphate dehydrogenase
LARGDDSLRARIVEDLPDLAAEVAYAVEHEMALTLRDVLERRLGVHLRSRLRTEEMARRVATLIAVRLGWDAARLEDEVRSYIKDVAISVLDLTDSPSS